MKNAKNGNGVNGAVRPLASGEVVSWVTARASYSAVLAALKDAGLEESYARNLLPRQALLRAVNRLSNDGLVTDVIGEGSVVSVQLTNRRLDGGEVRYEKRTHVVIDLASGDITSPDPAAAAELRAMLDAATEERTGSDVSRIVMRVATSQGDIFPIRENGCVYFVPQACCEVADKIEKFLSAIGGRLDRFPVYPGDKADGAVSRVVADGMGATIEEFESAVAAFGASTRPDTLQRAAERISELRFKAGCYAELMADRSQAIAARIAEAEKRLARRTEAVLNAREADAVAECDHCGCPQPVAIGDASAVCIECGIQFQLDVEADADAVA